MHLWTLLLSYYIARQCTALWGEPKWALHGQSCGGNKQSVTATKDDSTQYLAASPAAWIHDTLWYAHYGCTQGQCAPYCRTSASPFEVCPETAVHKLHNCSSRSYSQLPSVYRWWARLDWCCCVAQYNDHLKHSAGKIWSARKRQLFSLRVTWYVWYGRCK